jgi:hypothetical protein
MALLTNINGKFSVDTDGAASFNRIGASTTTGFTFPSADGANGEVLKTNGSGTVSWSPDSSPTVYWAANGNDIYNTNSANVGIGTNSPTSPTGVSKFLHISGSPTAGIVISDSDNADYNWDIWNSGGGLFMKYNDTTFGVCQLSSGNVGIGTTSPDFALDIEAVSGGVQLQMGRTTTSAGSTWMGSDSNGFHLGVGAYGAGNSVSDPNGFTVLTSGNVGIGTVLPGEYGPATGTVKLDVKSGDIIRSGFNNPANSWIGFTSLPGYAANSYPSVTSKSSLHFANNDKYCAFLEGTDTYFGVLNSALNTTVFFATGSQNSYLTGSGNFGVGVTGPLAKLHVVGGTGMTGGWGRSIFLEDTYPAIVYGGNATKYAACAYDHSTDVMRWYTGAATSDATQSANLRMSLQAGRLGIGTDSPAQKLHIKSTTSGPTGIIIENTNNSQSLDLDFWNNVGAVQGRIRYNEGGGSFDFSPNVGAAAAMSMAYSGNVGIGEPNPNYKLNIASATNTDGIYLSGTGTSMTNGEYRQIQFGYSDTDTSYGSTIRFVVPDATTHGGQIEFYTDETSVGTLTRAMTIDNSQNVGIGVTAPSTKLHIEQNNLAGASVYNTNYTQLTIENSGSAGIQINSATYGIIYFGDASSPIAGQWLYVHSSDTYLWMTAAVTTMSLNATALTVKGDVVAYGSPSDIRLKENIKPIESALDKVSKLQGVTFDWKKQNLQDDKELTRNWKNDIGFIAQDVQKVIPELVRENEDGMLSMRHQGIAPILLEAIKELKAEIEELKLNKCNCDCKR